MAIPPDAPARRGGHDLGGLERGPVEAVDPEPLPWEKRIDALRSALGERGLLSADQLRRHIEELPPEVYAASRYYERWAMAVAGHCLEQGLLTREELDAEIARLRREAAP
jgi:hypothetical protein